VEIQPEALVNVSGDRDALSQVLLNLLTNAEKYASCGGVVNVRLEAPDDRKVILRVQDRGPGISKLHQRRIFEKFYRADESISSGIEGSGIGLALSKQIIEKHEGQIWYARREGGGSCFAIELPISGD
jgi:signal transduction histidine kinase